MIYTCKKLQPVPLISYNVYTVCNPKIVVSLDSLFYGVANTFIAQVKISQNYRFQSSQAHFPLLINMSSLKVYRYDLQYVISKGKSVTFVILFE